MKKLLEELVDEKLIQVILSNSKDSEAASKAKIRPVKLKDEIVFQKTTYRGTQVFHANFSKEEIVADIEKNLQELFRQCEIKNTRKEAVILVSKKGKVTIKTKQLREEKSQAQLTNNREKSYILPEGSPVDFLIKLGVQTEDGKINKSRYDKFRQINRYLEFIEDVLEELPKDRTIQIIDFGCGKSYLTFAMYYFLHTKQGRDIEVVGLDLKKDVINHCNQIAEELGYEKLHFEMGDIKDYEGKDSVDLVVSLHACDTATDYALAKAVKWNAKVIMAVPCCQHEVNKQIQWEPMDNILKYGLLKERMSALITDGLRANYLEEAGYRTQILEFIDMEHTPKNLLIRAVRNDKMHRNGEKDILRLTQELGIHPTLGTLLKEEL